MKIFPDYRTIWRWHFYAGVLCIPFVIVLSISGSIYLFKSEIESWLDTPYDHLVLDGERATPEQHVQAALRTMPDAAFVRYQLPPKPQSAVRITVRRGVDDYLVYVHPHSCEVMKTVREDERLMRYIFRLHGELWMGDRGSNLVELASSWTIVMILTGLYLWWPTPVHRLAGVWYPRLRRGTRVFWRDLHAVIGVWISVFALFLLLTGLPWAKLWGTYFRTIRQYTGLMKEQPDWPIGNERTARLREVRASGPHVGERHHQGGSSGVAGARPVRHVDVSPLNKLVPLAQRMQLPPPVVIASSPVGVPDNLWTIESQTPNRPRRIRYVVDATSLQVVRKHGFADRHFLDKLVSIGIAAHEGRLFGWPNQLLGLLTAVGLIALCLSALVLWWRRREPGTLGAPPPPIRPSFSWGLAIFVVLLAVYLPLFGVSLVVVWLLEKLVLARIPSVSRWLGLVPHQRATRNIHDAQPATVVEQY